MSDPEPTRPATPGEPTPPVPPAAPTPPVPPVPPVPQYGEYAPPGYVPPAPSQPASQQPTQYQQQPQQYGQPQHQQPQQYAQQPYGAASYPQQAAKRRKTWDLVLTIVLLALGLFGMLLGVIYGALFSDPTMLDATFEQQGFSGFNGQTGAWPTVLVISHIVLYLLALGISLPLLITKRVAFWVPLSAGVIAAIIFWACLLAIFASDPAFLQLYS